MSQEIYLNNAMESNNKLMRDLNTFNLQYAKYIKCNGSNPPPTLGNCLPSDVNCCSSSDIGNIGLTGITTLKGTILTDIDNARTRGNILYGNLISGLQFQNNQQQITSDTEKINKLRSELDIKMKELYNIDGNLQNDYMLQYDSVMYTGILFSILATTLLYYTFTKI
jgi:hypothetical protein